MSQSQRLTIDQAISLAEKEVKQGNFPKALQLYNAVLQHQPNHPIAKEGLIKLQKELPRNQPVQIKPANPSQDQSNALLNLYKSGEMTKAEQACRKLLQSYPQSSIVINILGLALKGQGKSQEAVQLFDKAIQLKPDFAIAYNNRGNALQMQGRLQEAVQSFDKAIQLKPDYILAYSNRGSALQDLGDLDKAMESYNKAIQLKPDFVVAYHNIAGLFAEMGQINEAIVKFKKAISLKPDFAKAHYHLSNIIRHDKHDDTIRAMETLYNQEDISSQQREYLAFGLGKAFEDLNEHNQSYEYILEGNRIMRESFQYSITGEKEIFDNLKNVYSSTFFPNHVKTGNPDKTPIFILGMIRSGTTLVEQILASHPQVYGAGELNDLSYIAHKFIAGGKNKYSPRCVSDLNKAQLFSLGTNYIERIRKHSTSANHITDKMPNNFKLIGFIRMILPGAKIVHCMRDPMDNCYSIYKKHFIHEHKYAYDLSELGQYYNLYLDLMDHWRKIIPNFIYDISYEALVSDQEEQTRKLLAFCQLPWEKSCLSFHKTKRAVSTASNIQVRRPMYSDSVNLWKMYETQLYPLQKALGQ